MSGCCTHNHPTQDGIPPQEGSKAEVVPPPKICPESCISLASILTNPIPCFGKPYGEIVLARPTHWSFWSASFPRPVQGAYPALS